METNNRQDREIKFFIILCVVFIIANVILNICNAIKINELIKENTRLSDEVSIYRGVLGMVLNNINYTVLNNIDYKLYSFKGSMNTQEEIEDNYTPLITDYWDIPEESFIYWNRSDK
jgi:hypothetical protein